MNQQVHLGGQELLRQSKACVYLNESEGRSFFFVVFKTFHFFFLKLIIKED